MKALIQLLAAGILLVLTSYAFGGITNVTRNGGSENCPPELGGLLSEDSGSGAYCDQSYTWINFPAEAAGIPIDYIVVSDADSSLGDYGLSVTVDLPGSFLLFIDQNVDVVNDMPWVAADGYENTGITISLDQGGPIVVFDIWELEIDVVAGPIVTGPQNDGAASNYGVAMAADQADLEISITDNPDPVIAGGGDNFVRTYTVQNLGHVDTANVSVRLFWSGVTDFSFVSRTTSPNSFTSSGPFRWNIPFLNEGEFATLTFTSTVGPNQTLGQNVMTFTAQIETTDTFDPDLTNNLAVESTSVISRSHSRPIPTLSQYGLLILVLLMLGLGITRFRRV